MGYTHGIKWSFQRMCDEINTVKHILNIDRMPSNSECKLVTGNCALSNAIRRSGSSESDYMANFQEGVL